MRWSQPRQANRAASADRNDATDPKLPSTPVETSLFDYDLPEAAIAQSPIEPRDAARLLRTHPREDRQFSEFPSLLQQGDLVVVNRTRVRAARLRAKKRDTGGAVEVLLLRRLDHERWEALIKPARRVRAGLSLDCGPIAAEVLTDPIQGQVVVAVKAPGRCGRDGCRSW